MHLLVNVIQPYAWGSRSAIAQLQGRPAPSPTPEAELWMGAHPAAPSRVSRGTGTADASTPLPELIHTEPERTLGDAVTQAFGPQLPFLLKVLAAETPLSLQAHPSLRQAREGFERENAAGVPLQAAHRNYKDPNHKPELICALGEFEALCGFRRVDRTLALFDALGVSALDRVLQPLRSSPDSRGLAQTFERLMTAPADERQRFVAATADACARHAATPDASFFDEARWAVRLSELYPGDAGVVGSLLLNYLKLQPGEAIYLPAGNLHAYLRGVGVEIMASSDNVLRGGCTPKHVDVPELLRVLDFAPIDAAPFPASSEGPGETAWRTPSREFRLSRLAMAGEDLAPARRGPEILLCVEGAVDVVTHGERLSLTPGASAFISASDGAYTLRGRGVLFRATPGIEPRT